MYSRKYVELNHNGVVAWGQLRSDYVMLLCHGKYKLSATTTGKNFWL